MSNYSLSPQEIVYGDLDKFEVTGADKSKGAFFSPILFRNDDPFKNTDVHEVEAFGPVSTIMPYKDLSEAIELTKMGKGSLVTSIITADDKLAREFVTEAACVNGRILVLNERCAKESTGHGSPMPLLTHGGPGRAGGGEEMGGKRGVLHYLQRTAIQGHPQTITEITQQFQVGADQPEANPHVFRKHFEEIKVGETVFTHKHTVTTTDIVNFASPILDLRSRCAACFLDNKVENGSRPASIWSGWSLIGKSAGLLDVFFSK